MLCIHFLEVVFLKLSLSYKISEEETKTEEENKMAHKSVTEVPCRV